MYMLIIYVGQTVIDIFEAAGLDIQTCSSDDFCGWSISYACVIHTL